MPDKAVKKLHCPGMSSCNELTEEFTGYKKGSDASEQSRAERNHYTWNQTKNKATNKRDQLAWQADGCEQNSTSKKSDFKDR